MFTWNKKKAKEASLVLMVRQLKRVLKMVEIQM